MSSAAARPDPFLGQLTTAEREELARWGDHYWNRVEHGTTLQPGVFKFDNPVMNSPLFNPMRGARATLESLEVLDESACDGLADLQPGMGDEPVRKALRAAMTGAELATDAAANITGTAVHLNMIAANPGIVWTLDGDLLTSIGLPWQAVSTLPQAPTAASNLSESTQAAITKLLNTGAALAAASSGVSLAESLLTGQESHADRFQRGIRTMLDDGGWNATTWRIDAAFAVFGSLPLVGVTFDDCFVLLDAVNGGMDGPFATNTYLDARGLLAAHEAYSLNSPVAFFSEHGCRITFGKGWKPTWPGPGAPPTLTLPAVGPPTVPAGGAAPWSCQDLPLGGCACTRIPATVPALPLYPTRQRCSYAPAGCGPAGSCGGSVNPTYPSGDPPPPGQGCSVTCVLEYFY